MHIYFGLQHKHNRKKQKVDTKKQQSKYLHSLDKLTFIAGIAGPFTVIPQIYQIFHTQNASGVSVTSWALLTVVTLPWVFYGIAHKDKVIIVSFILWEVVNILVVIGAFMYS